MEEIINFLKSNLNTILSVLAFIISLINLKEKEYRKKELIDTYNHMKDTQINEEKNGLIEFHGSGMFDYGKNNK